MGRRAATTDDATAVWATGFGQRRNWVWATTPTPTNVWWWYEYDATTNKWWSRRTTAIATIRRTTYLWRGDAAATTVHAATTNLRAAAATTTPTTTTTVRILIYIYSYTGRNTTFLFSSPHCKLQLH